MRRVTIEDPCEHGQLHSHYLCRPEDSHDDCEPCPGGSSSEITDAHPEEICDRCGGHNFSWVVDSDRFNLAAKSLGYDRGAVLCPGCFVEGHEQATGLQTSWQLVPATPFQWNGSPVTVLVG